MPAPDTDRNLLFAVLALQADCLTQSRFVEACTLWANQKGTPIADLLAERGWLAPGDRADIERLLERKLKKHGGDAKAVIAEVTNDAHIRQSLDAVPDEDIRATIAGSGAVGHVLLSTVNRAPEEEGERYTITRLHATGGIGRVWLARDGALGRDVALKDLRPERAANPAVWGRFLREAQITGQLEHPGIVPIYELGRRADGGQPFYTMRFVRGRTLREAITAYHQKRERNELGQLDLRELLTAFVGVCNAVAYAHSRGVIHRDLKPANVVLGEFGEVMVLDWGLAKEMTTPDGAARSPNMETTDASAPPATSSATHPDQTLEGQVLGTPAYMAPEQADGRLADIDGRTDVYGLGAILYELLAGRPPFTGTSTEEVLSRVRNLAPERPRDRVPATPRPLEAICLKALMKRPAERYQSAKALADDVLRFMADEPTTAFREPLTARAWRWTRRHRSLVTSLVAALVVAVPILVVGIVLLNRSEGRERDARQKEETARKDEEAARERAQANYQRAARAADALTEELARGIRPIAGTQSKTVIEILDRAKQISDDLLTDPDAPAEAIERKARMLVLFTELYRETNRTVPARQSVEQSIALFDRLLADRPGDRGLRIERAKAQNRLGWVLFEQGHLPECLAALRGCAAELEAVGAEADPNLAATFLASSYTYQGNLLVLYGDFAGAESMYQRGLDIRRKAVAAAGDNTVFRMQLGLSLEKYGVFLAKYRSARKDEGLALLREGRTQFEAMCKANPSDASFHLHFVRILTNLAEHADEAEAASCVEVAEKITERFVRRDPDHIVWQREDVRIAYERIAHKLKNANRLDPAVRADLRRAERKMLEDILVIIVRRNAQDPENHIWLIDLANMKAQLADAHVRVAQLEPDTAAAHLATARELARESLMHYEPLRARSPMNADTEKESCFALRVSWDVEKARAAQPAAHTATLLRFALHYVWKSERARALRPDVLVARWEFDARKAALAHRLVAAYPAEKYWEVEFRRAYFLMSGHWKTATEKPDWEVLGRPEVIRAMLGVAAVLADVPDGLSAELRAAVESMRKQVAATLRTFDAKGLLPADGKKILDRLPPPEKKE